MSAGVKTATAQDQNQVVDAIVLAFVRDPVARWVYPDPHQYVSSFREFVPAFGGRAFSNETAHYAGEFSGAALWLPPGVDPEEDALIRTIEQTVSPDRMQTLFGILEGMGKYHPSEPLWYLPLIGVDPTHQRRGIGGSLLRHSLERVDREQSLAYLESSNPENIPLYERHGFEVMGTIEVGDAPVLTPMIRRPR
jgi:ribosomal protein S18 acetylase RimI-like enzyme